MRRGVVEDLGQVEVGARDGGDGDAVDDGASSAAQRPGAVAADRPSTRAGRARSRDAAAGDLPQVVERRRLVVAEHRARPAGRGPRPSTDRGGEARDGRRRRRLGGYGCSQPPLDTARDRCSASTRASSAAGVAPRRAAPPPAPARRASSDAPYAALIRCLTRARVAPGACDGTRRRLDSSATFAQQHRCNARAPARRRPAAPGGERRAAAVDPDARRHRARGHRELLGGEHVVRLGDPGRIVGERHAAVVRSDRIGRPAPRTPRRPGRRGPARVQRRVRARAPRTPRRPGRRGPRSDGRGRRVCHRRPMIPDLGQWQRRDAVAHEARSLLIISVDSD